jgi:hypothetical protein
LAQWRLAGEYECERFESIIPRDRD